MDGINPENLCNYDKHTFFIIDLHHLFTVWCGKKRLYENTKSLPRNFPVSIRRELKIFVST